MSLSQEEESFGRSGVLVNSLQIMSSVFFQRIATHHLLPSHLFFFPLIEEKWLGPHFQSVFLMVVLELEIGLWLKNVGS